VEKRIRERLEEIKRLKQPTSDRPSNSGVEFNPKAHKKRI